MEALVSPNYLFILFIFMTRYDQEIASVLPHGRIHRQRNLNSLFAHELRAFANEELRRIRGFGERLIQDGERIVDFSKQLPVLAGQF